MSKLSKLLGKSKVFNIGGIDLEIRPLTIDELDLFNIDENASAKEQMKNTKELVKYVLKKSVPDATDDELNNIGTEYIEPIMNAILEVNGFSKSKIDLIKQKLGK